MADSASSGLMVRVRTASGTAWRWAASAQSNHLRELFDQSVCGGATELHWSTAKGRHVTTTRTVKRGEEVLSSAALGLVPLSSPAGGAASALRVSARVRDDMDALALDDATVSLALELWQHADASAATRELLSHAEHLSESQRTALRRIALELLPSASREATGAAGAAAEFAQLLLCVRSNAHRALDDDTGAKAVGLGLYPAAALVNHSCAPACYVSFSSGGRTLHVRAIVELPAGAEVTCSYLADEQLYAPWSERAAMLRAAHHFDPVEPHERAATERSALGALLAPLPPNTDLASLEARLRATVERAQKAEADGDAAALATGVDGVRALLHGALEKLLGPHHWLMQEAYAALIALGRAADDPEVIGRYAMQLIASREEARIRRCGACIPSCKLPLRMHPDALHAIARHARRQCMHPQLARYRSLTFLICQVLPRGTPHLATLYAAAAAALFRMVKDGRIPPAQRSHAAAQ